METNGQIRLPESLTVFDYHPDNLLHGTGNDNMYVNGEFNLIYHLLDKECVVLEVGANKGNWTKLVFSLTCPKMVYCFEPVPETYEYLHRQHFYRDNIKMFQGAVGNTSGSTLFYWYKNSSEFAEMSNMYGRPETEKSLNIEKEEIKVNITTLEEFLNIQDIDHVDFLKVDAEGAEFFVLDGCGKLINRIDYIQAEYGGAWRDSKTNLKDCFKLLSDNGFSIFRIVPEGLIYLKDWIDEFENYVHSNYLAISSEKSVQFSPMNFGGKNE